MNYHLTQLLTGYGCFESYLITMKLIDTNQSGYSREVDSPGHNYVYL